MRFLLRTLPKDKHRDARNNFGHMALHIIAFMGSFDMAEMVLEAAFDVNPVDMGETTLLDMVFLLDTYFALASPKHSTNENTSGPKSRSLRKVETICMSW